MKWMFVPGLNCRPEIFEDAARYWSDAQVIVLEWPWPERSRSMEDVAGWLIEQIELHAPDGITGHSLGGVAALYLHAYCPEAPRLPSVIVDTFLMTPHPFFRNHVWDEGSEVARRVREMLDAERPRFPELRDAVMSFGPPDDWRDLARRADAQFIYGGRSGEYDPATLGELAGLDHDDPRVQVVPETSHFLMLERPELFYAAHAEAVSRLLGAEKMKRLQNSV